MKIKEAFSSLVIALSDLYREGEARSIAKITFEDAFRIFAFSSEASFPNTKIQGYNQIKERLLNWEPIQYILGEADFYGLKLKVSPAVLIPRQETEELVFWIKETLTEEKRTNVSVLDIGTGSGCIPLVLKKLLPGLKPTALDVSKEALEIVQFNARKYELDVKVKELNILKESNWPMLPKYDIIVSNPPYIPHKEANLMQPNVLKYEPTLALFVEDEEPLIFYIKIAQFAKIHLNPSGYLFFELNTFNAEQVSVMLQKAGFSSIELRKDMNGNDRMIRAQINDIAH